MNRVNAVTFLLLVFFGSSSYSQQLDYKGFKQWSWGKKDFTEYYLYTPDNLQPGQKYPVALFLHGCCGDDYHATLRNTVDPPVRMWHNFGANTQKIPTYIIAPKTSKGWSQHFENIKSVIDSLIIHHQGDAQRIYITGFSMGAEGTWKFIEKYPGYFAAAIPMGMDFKGKNPENYKDIPIWTLRGETDWYAQKLASQAADIRKLNYSQADSAEHITGINPRITTFKGIGHGVQWTAASTQPLTDWAYDKVNDGNKYPIVHIVKPDYKYEARKGEIVPVAIEAFDSDGKISKVEVYVNDKLVKTLYSQPYNASVSAMPGDTELRAIAYDDKGKTSTAYTVLKVNIPVKFLTNQLKNARQGAYFHEKLAVEGNGTIEFSLNPQQKIPEGLSLSKSGEIKGIPVETGNFSINVEAKDEDGDSVTKTFTLNIQPKAKDEVLLTNVKNYAGKVFPVSKVMPGEMLHNDREENEITFSAGIEAFKDFTFIQTDANDTINAEPFYLEFEADEDVVVYVAYEKLDRLYTSTIPDWLKGFKKHEGVQITAQYFYYDIYSKDFPKGKTTLPDAMEKKNGVNTNYFVMVKKK